MPAPTPWEQDPAVRDRLDEHMRLQKAGMARQSIIAIQKINPDTYAEDEKRIKELALKQVQDLSVETFSTVMVEHWDAIERLKQLAWSPTVDPKDQVAALGKAAVYLWQIAKLMRIAPETGEPAWNGQQSPAGEIIMNDNRQVHIMSDPELMAEFNQKLKDFEARFQPMPDDERRRLLGSDNFKPAGEVWGDGSAEDEGDED